jgi:hypothetical protein
MAEDFYELIRERYERKALLLTSNRALDEWPEAFGNPLLASAALDRLTHHCHALVIRGQSDRQRGRRKEDLNDHIATGEPPTDGAALDPWPTPRWTSLAYVARLLTPEGVRHRIRRHNGRARCLGRGGQSEGETCRAVGSGID